MRRAFAITALIGTVGGLCWLFPLFHVVPLNRALGEKSAKVFDAAQFADNFWSEKLLKSIGRAAPVEKLLAAIQNDPVAAKTNYARCLGMGDSYIYFLRGSGTILSISGDEISVGVSENATNAEIVLETGLIFGNTLRDGTGLLSPSDYPDSQDFNDIAAALNKIAMTRVLPKLRAQAKIIGAGISFTGCAEVDDESTDLHPLHVVPIQGEVQ
jgi:predicted lipoprotein